VVTGSSSQPQSGVGPKKTAPHHARRAHHTATVNGPTAPSPALFSASNPLAGVLPGSWEDPFIVPGGTAVPQFFVQSFHIPPFLLAIYQSAATAYGVPWQILAAVNEVETDYGTNLDTSSAGAIGWMQFLPSTWKRYGVDAAASGSRDPYNAADAVFAAARYLDAAGAGHNLPGAIYAYNHSWAYVKSVLLRAQVLSGEPTALIQGVTELGEGDFPVQLGFDATYSKTSGQAPSASAADAATGATGATGATAAAPPGSVGASAAPTKRTPAAEIYAGANAAVVAAQDGTIVAIGHSRKLGRYVKLRNAFGDVLTYGNLATVSRWFTWPKHDAVSSRTLLSASLPQALAPGPRPGSAAASAGNQRSGHSATGKLFGSAKPATKPATIADATPLVVTLNLRSRLNLFTPLSALNDAARASTTPAAHVHHRHISTPPLARYFTAAIGIRAKDLELVRLRVGSHVLAGTILGRLAQAHARRPHLTFELQPAGSPAPVDPRPFLDAWSQLETLSLHHHGYAAAVYGPDSHLATVGAIRVASQVDLARVVLQDRRVTIASCERAAIRSGSVDRRVLAGLELLALHGIYPAVSGAWCASHRSHAPAQLRTGNAVALTARSSAHTLPGLAAETSRALRPLDSAHVSTTAVRSELVISFGPAHDPQALAASAAFTGGFALSGPRWSALAARLSQISEPRIPTAVSAAALADRTHR
jgi:hypothetical protein